MKKIISEVETNLELLGFCHVTTWDNFNKIVDGDCQLKIDFSKFPPEGVEAKINENVIYFHYGIPLYEPRRGNNVMSADYTCDMPICIIFKEGIVSQLLRFYPFDTGAAFWNIYKCFRTPFKEISDLDRFKFELEIENYGMEFKQFITKYFENNLRYCLCNPKVQEASYIIEEELLNLYLNFGKGDDVDQRAVCLEVHSVNNIRICEDTVLAIIVPWSKSEKHKLKEKIGKMFPGIQVVYYSDYCRATIKETKSAMLQKTINIYENLNKL